MVYDSPRRRVWYSSDREPEERPDLEHHPLIDSYLEYAGEHDSSMVMGIWNCAYGLAVL